MAGAALGLTVLGLLAGVVFGAPHLFWAYRIQKAGALMEQGMVWPDPRYSDSLPQTVNALALSNSLVHLDRAQRWRPQHFHGYRQQARVHMALGEWLAAERYITQARHRADANPLVQFDATLVYEGMMAELEADPSLQPLWDFVWDAPERLIEPDLSAVCLFPLDATACGILIEDLTLPVDGMPSTLTWEAAFLGLRRGQVMELMLDLPSAPRALAFLLAVHPDGPSLPSAGAGLSLKVRTGPEAEWRTVHQHAFAPADGASVWVPATVDLSPWAGQAVTLRLEAEAERLMGWGQLTLADPAAAAMLAQVPTVRWRETLLAGDHTSRDLMALATEADNRGHTERGAAWLRRAEFVEGMGR